MMRADVSLVLSPELTAAAQNASTVAQIRELITNGMLLTITCINFNMSMI